MLNCGIDLITRRITGVNSAEVIAEYKGLATSQLRPKLASIAPHDKTAILPPELLLLLFYYLLRSPPRRIDQIPSIMVIFRGFSAW